MLVSDLFGEGWFKAFVLINLYGVTSVIMMIEILFFNSIKRPFVRQLLSNTFFRDNSDKF